MEQPMHGLVKTIGLVKENGSYFQFDDDNNTE